MDAPLYPPAKRFEQPQRRSRSLNVRDTAIADLRANPTAWAIVLREMPNVERSLASEQLKPHLGNFSFQSLLQFGAVQPDALAKVDAGLKALGEAK